MYIFACAGGSPLPWDIRLKIAIGAARGMTFLHTSETQVIYRDFKASNILLDGVKHLHISATIERYTNDQILKLVLTLIFCCRPTMPRYQTLAWRNWVQQLVSHM